MLMKRNGEFVEDGEYLSEERNGRRYTSSDENYELTQ